MDTMKLKVGIGILVVVFVLSGFFAGVTADRYFLTKASSEKTVDPNPRATVIEIYANRLDMTAEQKAEMGRILDETSAKYSELRKTMKPQFDEIRNGARQRIRATLTPEQQPKYDALVQEREAARQQQKNDGKK